MKYINKILLLILLAGASVLFAANRDEEPIRFQVDHRIRPSDKAGYGQLEMTIKVPNKSILFKKSGEDFEARLDVTISILHDGKKIAGDTWFETITTRSYDKSIASNQFTELKKTYDLNTEDMEVVVYVADIFTQRKGKKEFTAELSLFKDMAWSLGEVFPADEPIHVDSTQNPPVRYIRFIFSAAGKEGKEKFTFRIFDDGKKIREGYFFVNLKKSPRDYAFPVSIDELGYKTYTLELSAMIDDEEIRRSTRFQIRWEDMSTLIHDLDLAVRQMRYLRMTNFIQADEYQKMLNTTGDEQKKLFQDYWKRNDPSPTTRNNELMNEYFHRIELANQQFSGFLDGWESDRGMIYTIFGEPDDVEQHTFDLSTKPYIIWYYHNLNRQFVFMDYTGFGDYQLTDPVFDVTY
ncbi:GWxTD domain-containing protein [Fidelibacter multiformis]|uniref:GWxTD domain-containing protein n=1 Tax=Fidelibacter multiformis TaxID=3377529 RepID=UPI0037DC6588